MELRGLDRWLEREDDDGYPPRSFSPRWVWCNTCQRDDEECNQNTCRRCGSRDINHRGGVPRRRR